MKSTNLLLLLLLPFFFTSCEVIASVFKAGVWTGILAVVLVLVFVGIIIVKALKK